MGTVASCCTKKGFSEPEAKVGESETQITFYKRPQALCPAEERKVQLARLSKPRSNEEVFNNFFKFTKQIVRIQARFRGLRSRKTKGVYPGLQPITIIKYISEKMPASLNKVRETEKQLKPLAVDWDIKAIKDKIELRKISLDTEGNIYMGYWNKLNNTKEGYGQLITKDGSKSEGFFLDDKLDGYGRRIFSNGDYYLGHWKAGKCDGYGILYSYTQEEYEGTWKNDMMHGKGKQKWKDGAVLKDYLTLENL